MPTGMKALLLAAVLTCLCVTCEESTTPGDVGGDASSAPTAVTTADSATGGGTGPPPTEATGTSPTSSPASGLVSARVVRVVDGDTIDVELDGEVVRVRYIGIDTPETVDPDSPVECYGHEATERNAALVSGRVVELEMDVSETDRYGRLLRYVYVDGRMVNEELVRDGFATSLTYPPDVKYQERFVSAQTEAWEANRGLWGSCQDDTEASGACPEGCVSPPPGCEIKGNINSEGVKIYHVPSGEFYDRTVIDPSQGERWFCTADEAVANGWRASLR